MAKHLLLIKNYFLFLSVMTGLSLLSCSTSQNQAEVGLSKADSLALQRAKSQGELVNEGYERCRKYVQGWLAHRDKQTGLIPRNLQKDTDIWNAKDAAADNYPFMVLTASFTDSSWFEGEMKEMLATETRLTSRIGHLPDTYSFSKQDFLHTEADIDRILFGASEYIKDGLLPLTEWLGESPWSDRMIAILDDMWANAPVDTPYGKIVSLNKEENGEMLQVLSRVYWMTQNPKYLKWAIRLGDFYLLDSNHPTRDFEMLRLRDHGCEIVSGLCELYATVSVADPEKRRQYRPEIHAMLDRILEVGRNEDGLFYDAIHPITGAILRDRIADNFGYTFNGFYTVYQIDSIAAYRAAVLKGLSVLDKKYRNFDWENGSSDGYADAIEGALNLLAREYQPEVKYWIDSEIQVMWNMQQPNGIIEGWHGDGNFARTTIMYCLWKTKGVHIAPWRSDVKIGAEQVEDRLLISFTLDNDWSGTLYFDKPRHKEVMHLPWDWPRINQFPEWFTLRKNQSYKWIVLGNGTSEMKKGNELSKGLKMNLKKGTHQFVLQAI